MLKRDKHRAYSKEKKIQIDDKICETEKQLIQTKQKNKLKKEKQAIECMKENPKITGEAISLKPPHHCTLG